MPGKCPLCRTALPEQPKPSAFKNFGLSVLRVVLFPLAVWQGFNQADS